MPNSELFTLEDILIGLFPETISAKYFSVLVIVIECGQMHKKTDEKNHFFIEFFPELLNLLKCMTPYSDHISHQKVYQRYI